MDEMKNNLSTGGKEQLREIARRITKLRVAKGLSQEQFAQTIGLARGHYGTIERGERNPTLLSLIRIAAGLGVEVGTLFPPMAELVGSVRTGTSGVEDEAKTRLKPGVKRHSGWRAEALEQAQHEQVEQGVQGAATIRVDEQSAEKDKSVSLVSSGAAARLAGVNRRTITRWAKDGLLQAALMEDSQGKFVSLFKRDDILRVAAARRRERQQR